MSPPGDAAAPGVTGSEGGNGNHLAAGTDHRNHNPQVGQDAAKRERLLIGALINCPPSTRDRVINMLAVDDFEDLLCADAFGIIKALHNDGVTDIGDLAEQFRLTVNARKRALRQPGDEIPFNYGGIPATWLANQFTAAAALGDERSAVLLALPIAGSGRRRAIVVAAERLAQAARGEADDDDLAVLFGKLIPLLTSAVGE